MKTLNKTLAGLVLATLAAGTAFAPVALADEERVRGRDLMSAEERAAHGSAMRSMNSEQDRNQYREAMHAQMSQRAAEQGKTLAGGPGSGRGGRGSGYGYGYGAADDDHRGYGRQYSEDGGSPYGGGGYGRGGGRAR